MSYSNLVCCQPKHLLQEQKHCVSRTVLSFQNLADEYRSFCKLWTCFGNEKFELNQTPKFLTESAGCIRLPSMSIRNHFLSTSCRLFEPNKTRDSLAKSKAIVFFLWQKQSVEIWAKSLYLALLRRYKQFCRKFENSKWPPFFRRQKFLKFGQNIPWGSKISMKSLYLALLRIYQHFCVFLVKEIVSA